VKLKSYIKDSGAGRRGASWH